ncbi:MAG: hypothetical protein HZC02_03905 [Candidatus Levybacteria bacterium]|nr:hypothetical protein [Candidatus Levybacteria bacterium]
MRFFSKGPPQQKSSYQKLHAKWSERHASLKEKLFLKHKESIDWIAKNVPGKHHIAAGSLGGLLLLAPPLTNSLPTTASAQKEEGALHLPNQTFLLTDLQSLLPAEVRPLTSTEEGKIADLLSGHFKLPIKAEIDGKRLNRSYGLIGAEQHLMRYPGDTIGTHFSSLDEASKYARSGMAPGRGAWGYFTYSQSELTQKDIDREKYYIAVQTFLASGYSEHVREFSEFFKFRKMLVVNPQNGKAMVVVIGDAGPAVWTGKHLGGSPEVMSYLERVDGKQRGPVLYFFIDDPNDSIPLGPIEI